ncbi:MAG: hypothetical protein K2K96_07760 [Lachnospiraceae bacterium]|nr:hypothetical protein [Lachnospiraceae bacterium]
MKQTIIEKESKISNTEHKQNGLAEKWLPLAVCVFFYVAMCLIYGPQLGADSNGYIHMISAREPVYPLFLMIFRRVFGEARYLYVVAFAQNLLMAFAVWYLTMYLKQRFAWKEWMTYVMIAMHFAVALLCQFAAGRASIFPNSILTEGITLSLWLIFITFLLKALWEKHMRYVLYALILAAVMMDVRKQMAVGYIVLFGTLLLGWIGQKGYFKRMAAVTGMILCSILLALGGTRLYNYVMRGEFTQNTRDMNLVLTTSLYIAEKEDASLIDEPVVRELFVQVMELLEEKECNYRFAKPGWRNLEAHYGAHYDKITIDTTGPMFIEYAMEQGFAEGLEAEQEADRMSGVIVRSLLADNLGTYLKVYLASVGNGLINSVAKRNALLDWYALAAYLIYCVLMALCLLKKETRRAGLFGLTVVICIGVNVGVTAALIFCQTRYMIYNMALFYMAGILMFYEWLKSVQEG